MTLIIVIAGVATFVVLAKQGMRDRRRLRQIEVVRNPRRAWW